jgi:type IV pilus assembly protein PilE
MAHLQNKPLRTPRGCGGRKSRAGGFTLIELMITVAIVAILAAVAYPSYTRYVVRSNRAAAQAYMLELTGLQQRYLLDARAYAGSLGALLGTSTAPASVTANYTLSVAPKAGIATPSFVITATPIGNQLSRDTICGTLTIDEAGAKTASGTGTSCW